MNKKTLQLVFSLSLFLLCCNDSSENNLVSQEVLNFNNFVKDIIYNKCSLENPSLSYSSGMNEELINPLLNEKSIFENITIENCEFDNQSKISFISFDYEKKYIGKKEFIEITKNKENSSLELEYYALIAQLTKIDSIMKKDYLNYKYINNVINVYDNFSNENENNILLETFTLKDVFDKIYNDNFSYFNLLTNCEYTNFVKIYENEITTCHPFSGFWDFFRQYSENDLRLVNDIMSRYTYQLFNEETIQFEVYYKFNERLQSRNRYGHGDAYEKFKNSEKTLSQDIVDKFITSDICNCQNEDFNFYSYKYKYMD